MEEIPELMPHLHPIWDAFCVLNRGRQEGMSVCRLAVSDVYAYLDGNGIADADLRDLYVRCIQSMDDEFISYAAERSKSPSRGGVQSSGTARQSPRNAARGGRRR